MPDKRKTEAWLNETARAWKAAEAIPGNEAEAEKLRNYVWEWADRRFNPKNEEYITDVIFSCIMNFNPERGAFCNYLSFVLRRRRNGYYEESYEKEEREENMSAPVASGSDDDSLTIEDTLASDANLEEEAEARLMLASVVEELTSLILNYFQCRTGHAANKNRWMWYRLFFTENTTNICKVDPSIIQHPRDVFSAMELTYLDYYMSEPCHTPKELKRTPLKPYCDVVPDSDERSTEWLEDSFPGDVSLFYLLKTTGTKPGRSARSNQLKFYREELMSLL